MQPGHYKNDFNMDLPAVLPPYATAIAPAGKTVGTNYYNWYLGYNNYMCSGGVKLQGGDMVRVEGRAKSLCDGGFHHVRHREHQHRAGGEPGTVCRRSQCQHHQAEQ